MFSVLASESAQTQSFMVCEYFSLLPYFFSCGAWVKEVISSIYTSVEASQNVMQQRRNISLNVSIPSSCQNPSANNTKMSHRKSCKNVNNGIC